MFRYAFLAVALFYLGACHKTNIEPPANRPVMDYTEYNQDISFGQSFFLDLDNNGSKDFLFYSLSVGDPAGKKEYRQFHFGSSYVASLAIDSLAGHTLILSKNAAISPASPAGLNWYNASGAWLARKVTGNSGAPSWEGGWKNARHQYLAVRVERAGLNYYGWVEISFDSQAEKIILHRAAICREAEKEVRAGI